jgi:hypothetical protein
LYIYGYAQVKLRKMGWNNKEILLKINMQTESWLFHKLKWLLIQFIKKYPSQYRYLSKYLLDWFFLKPFLSLIDNWPKLA